jgi:hypothetical protein
MDQKHGNNDPGESTYDIISKVMAEHGIGSIKASHDPAGNAQVLYNGLANHLFVYTRESGDLPLGYRATSSRVVDDRKAVKKVRGAWEDDSYDRDSYAYNTWRQNSEKPARIALGEELAQMRKDGADETAIARFAWRREQELQKQERKAAKGIRL